MNKPFNGNGWVWIGTEPVCLFEDKNLTSEEYIRVHIYEQERYIERLQTRVDRIKDLINQT